MKRARAVWCAIALALMLTGGGVILRTVYRDSRLPSLASSGFALFVFGFTAALVCLGVWVAIGGHRGPEDGP